MPPTEMRNALDNQFLISSSSIYRGELSFLQPVHFCICWRDNAVLTGYLFPQWPACVCVPNWKRCRKMCMVTSATYTVADIIYAKNNDLFKLEGTRK